MAARRRLSVLPSCPTVLQSCLGILQFCLSILQSRPVSPQSSPRRSSVLALYFDQLRAPFTESTPPAAAKSHAPFTGSAPLLPPKPQSPIAGLLRCCRRSLTYLLRDLPRRGGLLVAKTKIPPLSIPHLPPAKPSGWSRTRFRQSPRMFPHALQAKPSGGPADWRCKMALGGPAKRPLATLQKQKSEDIQLRMPSLCFQAMLRLP